MSRLSEMTPQQLLRECTSDMQSMSALLIAEAAAQHEQHPQYRDHWVGWVAVAAKRQIVHRGTVVVERGEFVLMNPRSVHTVAVDDETCLKSARGKTFATFYFVKPFGCDTTYRVDAFDSTI